MVFHNVLGSAIREGSLTLIEASGRTTTYGNGLAPRCTLRLHRHFLVWWLALNPSLRVGEAYMNGDLTIESGSLRDFMDLATRNFVYLERHWLVRLAGLFSRQMSWVKQHNPIARARRNVAHHYDLSDQLYDLFLDRDRQYSCAYFRRPDDSLDRAQLQKKRHIAAKLLLDRPGLRVLDIGSGWGGMALYLAEAADCAVTGITLSTEQQRVSEQRIRSQGLGNRIAIRLEDYREVTGTFDRIVSVGMFEHVGKKNYAEFFARIRDLLSDDGVCLLHSIGRYDRTGPVNPFIRKYIFPGTDLPRLSEVLDHVEGAGLYATDLEVLRLHYAETLRHWNQRFQANRSRARAQYDEGFCRMWELYLVGCEMGFRCQGMMVFQLQITKSMRATPLTRDYMYEWEQAQAGGEAVAAE